MLESNAAAQALINRRLAESEEHSQWLLEQRNALSATVKTPSVYSNPAFAVFSKAVRPAVSSAHTAFPVHHVSGSSSNLSASTPAQGRFSSGGMGDNGSDMLQRTKEIIREQVRASAVRAAARIPSRESSTGSVPQPIAAWQSHGRCCRRRGRVFQINAGIYEAVIYSHGYKGATQHLFALARICNCSATLRARDSPPGDQHTASLMSPAVRSQGAVRRGGISLRRRRHELFV